MKEIIWVLGSAALAFVIYATLQVTRNGLVVPMELPPERLKAQSTQLTVASDLKNQWLAYVTHQEED